jgi:anti-sigma factor ChrR (cupin superfamily)
MSGLDRARASRPIQARGPMDRNNVHVSLWYKDKQEEPGAPPLGPQAHGVAVNANFMVGPDYMPRAGQPALTGASARATLAGTGRFSAMATPLSQIISLSDLAWQERQPGVRTKTIWEHLESKRRAVMTRIEPDAKLPLHRHVGDELVFVIEGAIADEFGTVTAGNVGYRPDGCVHTVSAVNGATVLAIITGGVEPLTQRGSGPPSQVVTLSELPWIEARPGVRQKRIWEDKVEQRRAILARFEPGATLARHRHVGDELIFMIEGANADESGPVSTGNMNYRPNGCVHTVTTKNGATVLAVVWGSTEPA